MLKYKILQLFKTTKTVYFDLNAAKLALSRFNKCISTVRDLIVSYLRFSNKDC